MRVHRARKVKNLPFTVKKPDGNKVRFTNPEEAWRFMMVSGGSLYMAFRTSPKGV